MIRRHDFDLGLGNLVCKLLLEFWSSLVVVYCNYLPDQHEDLKRIIIHSHYFKRSQIPQKRLSGS